jgi:hypothetical protein
MFQTGVKKKKMKIIRTNGHDIRWKNVIRHTYIETTYIQSGTFQH